MSTDRLELVDRGDGGGAVAPPLPPDDPEAWYAPDVRSQTEVSPGVVVTIRETATGFDYQVREPGLTDDGRGQLDRVLDYFGDASLERPRTREGAAERMADGFGPKHRRVIDRLVDAAPGVRRRIEYHALSELGCLGRLTPYALDDRIDVADVTGDGVVVHTERFAPAETDLPADPAYLDRFTSERLDRHTVDFHGFEVPVVVYRENLLGSDSWMTKYAVREPDLLPGDADLVAECKERIWETDVDGVVDDEAAFVRDRARELLSRRLTARNTRAWFDAARHRVRSALAEWGLAIPPVDDRYATDRLDDLVYYVLRDYVGYGKLTVPVRDDRLEDVEANRVGERVKVVPRDEVGHSERIPTNLTFDDESEFVNVVKQLAAEDGTELNAANPSAKVNLSPPGVSETIRCAVALPTVSEDGPHISIRKQAPDVMTPVDLLERDSLPTELVAMLWQLYENQGVVLFCGPTGVGKTTLMNAHMPFVSFRDRPVSIDEGSREVWLPHETGVSLTTRDHQDDYKQVTMADLMTETNYLNPDVELIAEINTPESFETFAEVLNTGHGVIGTTHAGDVETLVNRVVEQDLPTYLLSEIDLLVFPRKVDGERYVGEVVEFVGEERFREYDRDRDDDACGVVRKGETTVYWNTVARRTHDGSYDLAYEHPDLGDDERRVETDLFDRIADLTDQPVDAVENAFHRKHGYVRYLQREGVSDGDELFAFLADLQTNEAATVERIGQHTDEGSETATPTDEQAGPAARTASRETITLDDAGSRNDRGRAERHAGPDGGEPEGEADGD
ncbi:type II/IV secretion system ATPase subunit [Halosimplex halophilum]|uniref:type II/IV secretion system ATPase subunit n=1 Tax=Halosimplex halophilum TaxID=2559572 RepID=UPI00107F7310|nr:type II/IV secretion system ATPase subunit [Halosimplex halophilum]